jgi:hypothetical protein
MISAATAKEEGTVAQKSYSCIHKAPYNIEKYMHIGAVGAPPEISITLA